jgi:REP element-mobilizing transposase RayT
MQPSAIGRIVEDVWRSLPKSFPGVELDEFIVMPHHIHGLLWLPFDGSAHLEDVITRFKAEVTRLARKRGLCRNESVWQGSFFERVVRSPQKLEAVREYIRTNPERWIRR